MVDGENLADARVIGSVVGQDAAPEMIARWQQRLAESGAKRRLATFSTMPFAVRHGPVMGPPTIANVKRRMLAHSCAPCCNGRSIMIMWNRTMLLRRTRRCSAPKGAKRLPHVHGLTRAVYS